MLDMQIGLQLAVVCEVGSVVLRSGEDASCVAVAPYSQPFWQTRSVIVAIASATRIYVPAMSSGSAVALSTTRLVVKQCPLADKLPKLKKSGNIALDHKMSLERQNFKDCLDLLWSNMALCGDCASYLRQMVLQRQEESIIGDDGFDQVSVFGRLDETFLAQWVSDRLKVSMGIVGLAKVKEPQFVRQAAQALLNIGQSSKAPELCKQRAVMMASLKRRYDDAGERADLFQNGSKKIVAADGTVNWLHGVYSVTFGEDGAATEVEHRPTRCVIPVPDDIQFNTSFAIVNDWDDSAAQVERGRTKYRLREMFGKSQGPNLMPTWCGKADGWSTVAAACAAEVQHTMAKQVAEDAAAAEQSFITPIKAKRAEATAKARTMLAARKQETAKRRKVALSGFSTAQPKRAARVTTS